MNSAIPPYLIFFPTARCNMKCGHCFYWNEIENTKSELDIVEIEKIARSLKGLFFLRISGGEPFIRQDLPDIVEAFYRYAGARRIGLSTNGFLTERIEAAVRLIARDLKNLQLEIGVSIDGIGKRHDQIRQCRGAYQRAMDTYDRLAEIRRTAAHLKIGFLMTMMKDNQNELERLVDILKEKRPDSIGCNLIRPSVKEPEKLDVDIAKYDMLQKILDEYNRSAAARRGIMQGLRSAKAALSHEYIMNMVRSGTGKLGCAAGDKIAVLYPNGDVAACEQLSDIIGNVREKRCDFRRLWRDEKRTEFVRKIKDSGCFCTHECFITASMIFNPRQQLKILSRWAGAA